MPIDYATARGQVRLLIADVDDSPVLTDGQIAGYLAMRAVPDADVIDAPVWSVKRAAADALSAIATSEALVSKVIRTQDLSTDGARVAAELRAQAQVLRSQADQDETDEHAGFLEVVEFAPHPRTGEW